MNKTGDNNTATKKSKSFKSKPSTTTSKPTSSKK